MEETCSVLGELCQYKALVEPHPFHRRRYSYHVSASTKANHGTLLGGSPETWTLRMNMQEWMGSPPGPSSLTLQSRQKKYHAAPVSLERTRWITRVISLLESGSVCARIRFPSVGVAKQRFQDIHSPTIHLLQRPHGIYWRINYKVSLTRKLANAYGVAPN